VSNQKYDTVFICRTWVCFSVFYVYFSTEQVKKKDGWLCLMYWEGYARKMYWSMLGYCIIVCVQKRWETTNNLSRLPNCGTRIEHGAREFST